MPESLEVRSAPPSITAAVTTSSSLLAAQGSGVSGDPR
jgi:hypothetical protein